MRNPFVGLVDIAFLWIAIAATIISFRKVNVGASWLMVPYLLWVSYAAALNFAIFWMNRPA